MKERQYLKVIITSYDGRVWTNPLQLKEAHLITKIARENKSCTVTMETVIASQFKLMFG